jgi:hypothetical protein
LTLKINSTISSMARSSGPFNSIRHPPTLRFRILAGQGRSLAGSVWTAPKPLQPRRGLCRSSSALFVILGVVDSSGVFRSFSFVIDPSGRCSVGIFPTAAQIHHGNWLQVAPVCMAPAHSELVFAYALSALGRLIFTSVLDR